MRTVIARAWSNEKLEGKELYGGCFMGVRIGFVILTWNSQRYIVECLESIEKMRRFSRSVIVVDNGSSDESVNLINSVINTYPQTFDWKLKVLCLDRNYGTTISRNKGIKLLLDENDGLQYICILDSDTQINETSFETLLKNINNEPSCGIIGPRMHDSNGVYQISGRAIPTLSEKILKVLPIKKLQQKGESLQQAISAYGSGCVPVGYLMSACWVFPIETIDKVGFLDENIFYAPEDVDYCIRCWKNGLRVLYCYDAEILHHWQRLSRKKFFSKHNYEHIKGLLYMFKKHKYLFSNKKFTIK